MCTLWGPGCLSQPGPEVEQVGGLSLPTQLLSILAADGVRNGALGPSYQASIPDATVQGALRAGVGGGGGG